VFIFSFNDGITEVWWHKMGLLFYVQNYRDKVFLVSIILKDNVLVSSFITVSA